MYKLLYSCALLSTLLFFIGCETVKGTVGGAACGLAKDANNAVVAVAGTVDANGTRHPGSIQRADSWIKENLW